MAILMGDTVNDENGMEILEHGKAAFPVACYACDLEYREIPWHWHDEFEVLFVIEGAAVVLIGKEQLHLPAGRGIFINAGTLHSVAHAGEGVCKLRSICWHPRLSGGRDDSIYWQEYTKELLKEQSCSYLFLEELGESGREAVLYFSDAWERASKEPAGYEFDLRHDLSKILVYGYLRQKTENRKQSEKEIRTEKRMKQMIEFIKENLSVQITIDEIAESAGVSVSECLRCFNSMFGITPIRYTRKLRLEKAAGMLKRGSSVSECSVLCGFDDMSYFAREFKKQYGCKPMEYKKRMRQKK